jgi:DNA (cytosine-5)-methyltransferase 1
MSRAYYNEIDAYAAQWLRNLIEQGLIADGDVDTRSIQDVTPNDVKGYTQCHFFAGIGGWSYALRLAGYADHYPGWTGSCPCQPFSSAGKREGVRDKRHLWPDFYRLIAECKPAICFGEQVASKDGLLWFAGVRSALETSAYSVAAADLCAAGVSAPHPRQRIYWMAHANMSRENGRHTPSGQQSLHKQSACNTETTARVEQSKSIGRKEWRPESSWWGSGARLGDDGLWRRIDPGVEPLVERLPCRMDRLRGYGNAIVPQLAAEFIGASVEAIHQIRSGA